MMRVGKLLGRRTAAAVGAASDNGLDVRVGNIASIARFEEMNTMADLHEAAALGAMERVVFDRVHRSALTDEELASAIDAALQVSEISPKAAVYGAWHRLLVLLAEVNTGRQPDAAWQWEGPRGANQADGMPSTAQRGLFGVTAEEFVTYHAAEHRGTSTTPWRTALQRCAASARPTRSIPATLARSMDFVTRHANSRHVLSPAAGAGAAAIPCRTLTTRPARDIE